MGNPPRTYQLPIVRNRTFQNQEVVMDEVRYENCKFIDCILVYSGGNGEAADCAIYPGIQWRFQAAAGRVVETLQRYGWSFSFGSEPPEEPIRFPSDAL